MTITSKRTTPQVLASSFGNKKASSFGNKVIINFYRRVVLSYPKIKPPSFYCSKETEDGVILHYRSRRKGYVQYVIGQLMELAHTFYNIDLGVTVSRFFFKINSLIHSNNFQSNVAYFFIIKIYISHTTLKLFVLIYLICFVIIIKMRGSPVLCYPELNPRILP